MTAAILEFPVSGRRHSRRYDGIEALLESLPNGVPGDRLLALHERIADLDKLMKNLRDNRRFLLRAWNAECRRLS
jgi:hypothetical protein